MKATMPRMDSFRRAKLSALAATALALALPAAASRAEIGEQGKAEHVKIELWDGNTEHISEAFAHKETAVPSKRAFAPSPEMAK